MIVATIGKFIDNVLTYTNYANNGEDIEIILNNGDTLKLTKKDSEIEENEVENCCANCSNPDSYGSLEGFYCNAKKCFIRAEQYDCEQFRK